MTSDSEMTTWRPIRKREWIHFFLGGNTLRSKSTGGTDTSSGKNYLFVLSVDEMLGKEVQVVLATLS